MTDTAARLWCDTLARSARVQHITRDGRPYLERYFVAGWQPSRRAGPAIFLHHFVASDDPGLVHSHPWAWSRSLIVVGAYREERCVDGAVIVRDYHPGDVNILLPDDKHRIELLTPDCWTLFLAAAYAQPWSFIPIQEC